MLETLVSSRIRRTLFEYLLTHSTDRFYLRGLAKQLSLSISPLRRELARLEQSGMLQAVDEGNMRFYTVNVTSPTFLQLQHAGLSSPNQSGTAAQPPQVKLPPMVHAIPVGVISAHSTSSIEASEVTDRDVPRTMNAPTIHAFRSPVLVGTALAGMALMLVIASLFYITMTNGRLVANMQRALTTRSSGASVVEPHAGAASGMMRGARWQLIPGSFGGFSTDSHRESY